MRRGEGGDVREVGVEHELFGSEFNDGFQFLFKTYYFQFGNPRSLCPQITILVLGESRLSHLSRPKDDYLSYSMTDV